MSQEEDTQHGRYDPHRLIFHMTLVGVLTCALGMSAAIIALYWEMGWHMFNLHIDVLGDYLRSPLAFAYNLSLLIAGSCFILASFGLYLIKYNSFTFYLALAGANCGLGVILVGIYPYNDPVPHHTATVFFIFASLGMFSLLVLGHLKHPELCTPTLTVISSIGIIASILLLIELNPLALTHHTCPADSICYAAILMWWHTLMTMLAGICLALMARNLLPLHQPQDF